MDMSYQTTQGMERDKSYLGLYKEMWETMGSDTWDLFYC